MNRRSNFIRGTNSRLSRGSSVGGGAPLLGVRGGCFIAHGSSEAKTIRNAIRTCKQYYSLGANDAIVQRLAEAMPIVYPTNLLANVLEPEGEPA